MLAGPTKRCMLVAFDTGILSRRRLHMHIEKLKIVSIFLENCINN
jgi:hypothetical protein